uniref:Uncharacterized protein n=1 Tax=Rhizophagus irregularis (strain DAOM 181602 / DAOM 197198 / MUCL 43194) TaxID=747089 RepID=U9V052_RHIID
MPALLQDLNQNNYLKISEHLKGLELDIYYPEHGFAIEREQDQLKKEIKELCEKNQIALKHVWYYKDLYIVISEYF